MEKAQSELSGKQREALEDELQELLKFQRKRQKKGADLPKSKAERLKEVAGILEQHRKTMRQQAAAVARSKETEARTPSLTSEESLELFPGLPASFLQQCGEVVHTIDHHATRSCLCFKHQHFNQEDVIVYQRCPKLFEDYAHREDALHSILQDILTRFGPEKVRFSIEGVKGEGTAFVEKAKQSLEYVFSLEERYSENETSRRNVLREIFDVIKRARNGSEGVGALQLLDGRFRFLAYCYHNNLAHIIFGDAPEGYPNYFDKCRRDIATLRKQKAPPSDEELSKSVDAWAKEELESMTERNKYIASRMKQDIPPGGIGTVVLGPGHYKTGNFEQGFRVRSPTLEECMKDIDSINTAVLEAPHYRTLLECPPDIHTITLTIESMRQLFKNS